MYNIYLQYVRITYLDTYLPTVLYGAERIYLKGEGGCILILLKRRRL
jgi:hypothetical protein